MPFVLVQPIFEKFCRVGDRNADVLINFDQRIMLLITILYRYDNYWNINPLHSYTLFTHKLKLLKLLPHERAPFQLFAILLINHNYSSVEDRKTLYHHTPHKTTIIFQSVHLTLRLTTIMHLHLYFPISRRSTVTTLHRYLKKILKLFKQQALSILD